MLLSLLQNNKSTHQVQRVDICVHTHEVLVPKSLCMRVCVSTVPCEVPACPSSKEDLEIPGVSLCYHVSPFDLQCTSDDLSARARKAALPRARHSAICLPSPTLLFLPHYPGHIFHHAIYNCFLLSSSTFHIITFSPEVLTYPLILIPSVSYPDSLWNNNLPPACTLPSVLLLTLAHTSNGIPVWWAQPNTHTFTHPRLFPQTARQDISQQDRKGTVLFLVLCLSNRLYLFAWYPLTKELFVCILYFYASQRNNRLNGTLHALVTERKNNISRCAQIRLKPDVLPRVTVPWKL